VNDEEDGILFWPQKVDDLTEKLLVLIENCHLRARFGLKARSKVEARFTWLQNAKKVVSFIENGDKRNPASQCSMEDTSGLYLHNFKVEADR
jgi:glycosyltransferase involved in cell wall biosynthesis